MCKGIHLIVLRQKFVPFSLPLELRHSNIMSTQAATSWQIQSHHKSWSCLSHHPCSLITWARCLSMGNAISAFSPEASIQLHQPIFAARCSHQEEATPIPYKRGWKTRHSWVKICPPLPHFTQGGCSGETPHLCYERTGVTEQVTSKFLSNTCFGVSLQGYADSCITR